MPVIRLPDGSQRTFDAPVSVADVAMSIGAGLAKAALAGKVNGNVVDTSFMIESDSDLAKPAPMLMATSATLTGASNVRCEPSGKRITGINTL